MTESQYIPRRVAEVAGTIAEGTKVTPEIIRVADRLYRIVIGNDRVYCTVDYKFTGNRWEWSNSKLTVDGEPHEIMASTQDFFRLFHDPDSNGLKRVDTATIEPMEPLSNDTPYLPEYRQAVEISEHRVQKIDSEARVSIGLHKHHLAMEFRLSRGVIRWTVGSNNKLDLILAVLDGFDVRTQVGNTVEEIFAFLADEHGVPVPTEPEKYPQIGSTGTPSVSNSVRVRRQTVIRN